MKKFRDAYLRGDSGEAATEVNGKLEKVAYWLGKRRFNYVESAQEAFDHHFLGAFEITLSQARGANETALTILKTASTIPDQASTSPLYGVDTIHEDGTRTRQWSGRFIYNQPGEANELSFSTPLAAPLGVAVIDSVAWDGHEIEASIGTISIVCETPFSEEGRPSGLTTTTVDVNQVRYDPDDETMYERPRGSSIRFAIDTDGVSLGKVDLAEIGYVSKSENPLAMRINVDELLGQVLQSVTATAQEYDDIKKLTN